MKQKQRWLVEEFAKFMRVVCMITRGKVPPIKKINIESDDVLNFFQNTEKVKPIQISTTLQRMWKKFSTLMISDFYMSLCYWKEGKASQNQDFLIQTQQCQKAKAEAYYRTSSQTINKARIMLSENCSSLSICNKVNPWR